MKLPPSTGRSSTENQEGHLKCTCKAYRVENSLLSPPFFRQQKGLFSFKQFLLFSYNKTKDLENNNVDEVPWSSIPLTVLGVSLRFSIVGVSLAGGHYLN